MLLRSHLRIIVLACLLAACSATPQATPMTPSEAPVAASPKPTALAPAATTNPSAAPATPVIPAMVKIEPSAVIDVPESSDIIWLTTDDTTIWATTSGSILRIDAATSSVKALAAPSLSGDTTIAIADDGLWLTRWSGDRVMRLDPKTGVVELSVVVDSAVKLTFIGDDLWVGREDATAMVEFDRTTGDLGRSLPIGPRAVSGLGDLWTYSSRGIKRVDPATGVVKATIPFDDEGNCAVTGSFPDEAWVTCFGRDVVPRAATRLDTAANTVATVAGLPACHGGSVSVIDGRAWFVGAFKDADRNPFGGLLLLNSDTGAVEKFLSFEGDPDAAVVAGGALWVPEEAGHTILRFDFEDLTE